jgi:hypothetical protein
VDVREVRAGGARDQPNNDVRIAMEDGSGRGDDLVICGSPSSSLAFSDPACSLIGASASTEEMISRRLSTCVGVIGDAAFIVVPVSEYNDCGDGNE